MQMGSDILIPDPDIPSASTERPHAEGAEDAEDSLRVLRVRLILFQDLVSYRLNGVNRENSVDSVDSV